jgi:hypothetical protein
MTYRLEPDESPRQAFGEYRYVIYKGSVLIARYWHDHRGDDHGIEFASGASESWPVGRMVEFLEGGGGRPIILTARAVAYLDEKLHTGAIGDA